MSRTEYLHLKARSHVPTFNTNTVWRFQWSRNTLHKPSNSYWSISQLWSSEAHNPTRQYLHLSVEEEKEEDEVENEVFTFVLLVNTLMITSFDWESEEGTEHTEYAGLRRMWDYEWAWGEDVITAWVWCYQCAPQSSLAALRTNPNNLLLASFSTNTLTASCLWAWVSAVDVEYIATHLQVHMPEVSSEMLEVIKHIQRPPEHGMSYYQFTMPLSQNIEPLSCNLSYHSSSYISFVTFTSPRPPSFSPFHRLLHCYTHLYHHLFTFQPFPDGDWISNTMC